MMYVDDTLGAGTGNKFNEAITKLRFTFRFGKWSHRSGTFLGSWIEQQENGEIHLHQADYTKDIKPISV